MFLILFFPGFYSYKENGVTSMTQYELIFTSKLRPEFHVIVFFKNSKGSTLRKKK